MADTFAPPAYLTAADNHSISAGQGSWLESVDEVLSNTPKYWGLALASGGTGIMNTGVAVLNWALPEEDKLKEVNLSAWLSEYDTDLAKYYRENKSSVDTMGFVLGALVPGMGGVKALNLTQKAIETAARAGSVGGNLSFATRLLVPKADNYLAASAHKIAATQRTAGIMQAERLKALGARTYQGVLESAAFETAALATQFRSPFLEDQEASDIAWNFALNTALGGGIIGALSIPSINKTIRQRVEVLSRAGAKGRIQQDLGAAAPVQAQAIQDLTSKKASQDFIRDTEAKIAQIESGQLTGDVLPATPEGKAIANSWIAQAKNNIKDINLKVMSAVGKLAQHKAVTSVFSRALTEADPMAARDVLLLTSKLIRVGDEASLIRRELREAAKAKQLGQLEEQLDREIRTTYYQLWGNKGEDLVALDGVPKAAPLADTVKLGGASDTIEKAVNAFTKKQKHTVKKGLDVADRKAVPLQVAQSRYLTAARAELTGEVVVQPGDIPFMEASFSRMASGDVSKVTIPGVGEFTNTSHLWQAIKTAKDEAVRKVIQSNGSLEEAAARANVTEGYVKGTAVSQSVEDNYLAYQSAARELKLAKAEDIFFRPKYMGAYTNIAKEELADATRLDADLWTASLRKANEAAMDNATHAVTGDLYGSIVQTDQGTGIRTVGSIMANLPGAETLLKLLNTADIFGSRPGVFSYTRAGYDNLVGYLAHIGSTKQTMDKLATQKVQDNLNSARTILLQNTEAAAEWSITAQKIKAAAGTRDYVLADDLMSAVVKDADGNVIPEFTIPFKNADTGKIWKAHMELNDEITAGYKKIRAAQGLEVSRKEGVLYAPNPDTSRLKHFVFVVDPTITGAGRVSMLHAASAKELEALVAKVHTEFPQWDVITKSQSQAYHKAKGDYDFSRTLHETHMDANLAAKGISSSPLPRTDGKFLAEDLENWHVRQFRALNAEIIHAKYEQPFKELEAYARASGDLDSSRYPNAYAMAEAAPNNPYLGYIKTALNVTNKMDMPLLASANRFVDDVVSRVWNEASAKLQEMKGVNQDKLNEINNLFEHHGFRPAYYDAETLLAVNHPAGQEVATRFIRAGAALLSTTFLRFDPFNGIVNKLGSTVLTSTELRHVLDAIRRKDKDAVGKLADIVVPGTGGDVILSPMKLIANSQRRFINDLFGKDKGQLTKAYEDLGVMISHHDQIAMSLENLTLTGTETAAQLSAKLEKAFTGAKKLSEGIETYTGNRFWEHYNRFIAADIPTQITDLAIQQGLMTKGEAAAIVRTFVNRTQVNYNAAQRPLLFQGPIGMAMGLFQSYQFNLMQQLFRYVSGGPSKELALFMGLQGTFFGLNGVPGFQALNAYVMKLEGNPEHKGLDDVISEGAPPELANFMLYGLPSNILHANLYVRGDATPQNPTVLPTSIGGFPLINMYGRFFGNLKRTAQNVMEGADLWPAFLSGLEHNAINRPLSGIAQVLRGLTDGTGTVRSYDKSGNFISGNDLFSLATLSRVAGGKPLDEAIVRNEMYKIKAIRAGQREKLRKASDALKLSMQAGAYPDSNQLTSVFETFLENGMKASDFNRWVMRRYMDANQSEVMQLQSNLSTPLSRRMQILLGGEDVQ